MRFALIILSILTSLLPADPITNSLGMTLLPIPAGTFTMGSPPTEKGHGRDEKQRQVTLSRPFLMASTEVTQAQWQALMGTRFTDLINQQAGPLGRGAKLTSKPSATGPDQPMCFVNWQDALNFCETLTQKEQSAGLIPTSVRYTLPTEAQWEYACRAGTQTAFHTGKTINSHQANFYGLRPYQGGKSGPYREMTTPVGSLTPNAWGLFDMHGNLYEWCLDWYEEVPRAKTDPQGPSSGDGRLIRGGAWDRQASSCRSAYRYSRDPVRRAHNIGFRIIRISSHDLDE